MSIASEITRLQGVKSDILTAIADKGVTVPAGSALDDCPGLIASIPVGGSVNIGGRTYHTLKLGKLEWTVENLDWKFEGITLNPDSTGWSGYSAWYYNNDEETYGLDGTYKCGLLYTQFSAIYIDSLLTDGWRVPTTTDFQTLVDNFSMSSVLAEENSVASGFPIAYWGGNDELGFKLLPCGKRQDWTFKEFNDNNYYGPYLWSKTVSSDEGYWFKAEYGSGISVSHSTGRNQGMPIRLCRDVT